MEQRNCPKCIEGVLLELSSVDILLCENCYTEFVWELKDGQESVLVEGKVGGRP